MRAARLLEHFDRVTEAPGVVPRLRRFILDLAVRGKLVEQDSSDEPASDLLKRIRIKGVDARRQAEHRLGDVTSEKSNAQFGLPDSWAWASLASLCISIADGDHLPPPKTQQGIPFLVIGNVRGRRIDFAGCRHVSQEYFNSLDPSRTPRNGDVLYTLVGSYGIPIAVDRVGPFCVQRHIGILRPSDLINRNFLARTLASRFVFDQASACATGIAQKTVPLSGLRRIAIPVAPLAEQHRIVAKVDELMALCDRLEAAQAERETRRERMVAASLQRLYEPSEATQLRPDGRFYLTDLPRLTTRLEDVRKLREAVLHWGVRGLLVPQHQSEEPAPSLLKASQRARNPRVGMDLNRSEATILNSRAPFLIPATWMWTKVDQCFEVAGGIQKTPHRTPVHNHYPYVGVANVYRGKLDLSHVKRFELAATELEKLRLKLGDILVVEGNGSASEVGRCAIWNGEIADCVHQNHIIRCRPLNPDIAPFVLRYLNSPDGVQVMKALAVTSSGLYNLSVGKIRNITIPLPPLAEQKRIVAKVDELMAVCDQLEAQLAAGAATSSRLLESLLHEALAHPHATHHLKVQ